MRATFRRAWTGLIVLILAAPAASADQFQDLLKRVPSQANAVLLLDVDALHQCPLGLKGNWAKHHEQNYLTGVSNIPPTVSKLVVGAQLNPTNLENNWKVTLAQFKQPTPLASAVKSHGGSLDRIEGLDVALLPPSVYAASLAPDVIAAWHPANRQEFGRYLRFARRNQTIGFSPYLQQAATLAGGAQGIMVVDLTDVLDPDGVRRRLQNAKAVAGKLVDLDQLTRLISGIRGVKVVLAVDDVIHGEIRIDFSDSVKPILEVAKPLFLEALGGMGSSIEDLDKWSQRPEDRAIVFYGDLTESGARALFSFLLTPASAAHVAPPSADTAQDAPVLATQKYYKSLTTLLSDLKRKRARTFSQQGHWYYQAAEQVDQLPMLNVDEELLKLAAAISETLRNLSGISRQVSSSMTTLRMNAQAGTVSMPTYGAYPNSYYGWGYTGSANVNMPYQMAYLAQQNSSTESAIRDQTWRNIDANMVAIRRKLTEKYRVEF